MKKLTVIFKKKVHLSVKNHFFLDFLSPLSCLAIEDPLNLSKSEDINVTLSTVTT